MKLIKEKTVELFIRNCSEFYQKDNEDLETCSTCHKLIKGKVSKSWKHKNAYKKRFEKELRSLTYQVRKITKQKHIITIMRKLRKKEHLVILLLSKCIHPKFRVISKLELQGMYKFSSF